MIDKLTKDQESKIPFYFNKWKDIGFEYREITQDDLPILKNYLASLDIHPKYFIILDSPMACQLAIILFNGQLGNQLQVRLSKHLPVPLNAQLDDQLREQVCGKLDRQLDNQLGNQLGNQLVNQLQVPLNDQLLTPLSDKLFDQLHDQLRDQLYDELDIQLDIQLDRQLSAQLHDQLDNQLNDLLDRQLGNQLANQLDRQLGYHLFNQLYYQLRDKLGEQLGEQLSNRLQEQLDDQLCEQLAHQKLKYYTLYGYGKSGNIMAGYCAFYDFLISEVKPLEEGAESWMLFKDFSSRFHYIFPFKDICFISQKPKSLVFEDDVLSNDQGPSVMYPDGYSLYALQGVAFEKSLWEKIVNQTITDEEFGKIENAEQQMAAMAFLKTDVLLEKLNAQLIDEGTKGVKLYKLPNFMDRGKDRYLTIVKCPSTGREYPEGVPDEIGAQGSADLAECWKCPEPDGSPMPLEDYLTAQEA